VTTVDLGIAGFRVGHWTGAATGVTVVLAPAGTVASVDVRGAAPATRETDLLEPTRTVQCVDAIVLCGGSAFGLRAADGVVDLLAERGQGYATAAGPVPIVPAAAVFDLLGSGHEVPQPEHGRHAALDADRAAPLPIGRVGAGRGVTVGKWRGGEHRSDGGLGAATARVGDATIAAVAVVNAFGDVVDDAGLVLAGSTAPRGAPPYPDVEPFLARERENTTLAVLVTDARLDKVACRVLAESAQDGFARAIRPSHTRADGDVAFALATGVIEGASFPRLRDAAADVTAAAIRAAVVPPGSVGRTRR
jgi:L-aminopeptidase/D-esterase-like protein